MIVINQQYLNCRLVQRFCSREKRCTDCSVKVCAACADYVEVPAPGWECVPSLTKEQLKDWIS